MRWMLRLAFPLVAFWLLLSGHFTWLLLSLGAVSVATTAVLVRRMETERAGISARLSLHLPRYCVWLAGEVLVSSLAVVRQVWAPRVAPAPCVDRTPTEDLPELSQVIYANSITMTPGTLSLTVDDEGIEVHALRASDLAVLQDGKMLRRVHKLEVR